MGCNVSTQVQPVTPGQHGGDAVASTKAPLPVPTAVSSASVCHSCGKQQCTCIAHANAIGQASTVPSSVPPPAVAGASAAAVLASAEPPPVAAAVAPSAPPTPIVPSAQESCVQYATESASNLSALASQRAQALAPLLARLSQLQAQAGTSPHAGASELPDVIDAHQHERITKLLPAVLGVQAACEQALAGSSVLQWACHRKRALALLAQVDAPAALQADPDGSIAQQRIEQWLAIIHSAGTSSTPLQLSDVRAGAWWVVPFAGVQNEYQRNKVALPAGTQWAQGVLRLVQRLYDRVDEWMLVHAERTHNSFGTVFDQLAAEAQLKQQQQEDAAQGGAVKKGEEHPPMWLQLLNVLQRIDMCVRSGAQAENTMWAKVLTGELKHAVDRFMQQPDWFMAPESEATEEEEEEAVAAEAADSESDNEEAQRRHRTLISMATDLHATVRTLESVLDFHASEGIQVPTSALAPPSRSSLFAQRRTRVAPNGPFSGTPESRNFHRFQSLFVFDAKAGAWQWGDRLARVLGEEVVFISVAALPSWSVSGNIDLPMNAAIWSAIFDALAAAGDDELATDAAWRTKLAAQGVTLCRIADIPARFGRRSLFLSHRWAPKGGIDGMPIAYLQEYVHHSVRVQAAKEEAASPAPAGLSAAPSADADVWCWIDNCCVPQVPAAAFQGEVRLDGPDVSVDADLALRYRANQASIQRLLWLFGDLAAACTYFMIHAPIMWQGTLHCAYEGDVMRCLIKHAAAGADEQQAAVHSALRDSIHAMHRASRAHQSLQQLNAWMSDIGSDEWHVSGWEPEIQVIQFPFSMPSGDAAALGQGPSAAMHTENYWTRFLNTFYSNASLPRRAWCVAEFLTRFLHRGGEQLCDAADWVHDLMSHFFGAEVGQVFHSAEMLHADALLARVACSNSEWSSEGKARLLAAGGNKAPSEIKSQVLLSMLSLEGLIGIVSNVSASRPGDVPLVVRALYAIVVREVGCSTLPPELDGMLTFLTHARDPQYFPYLLSADRSPLWAYLRWSASLMRQDGESLFLLERIICASWARMASELTDTRPAWSFIQRVPLPGKEATTQPATSGSVPSGPPAAPDGYTLAPETAFVLSQQGLRIEDYFLPFNAGQEQLHGMALCNHHHCLWTLRAGDTDAAETVRYGLCMQGVDDQIHSVVDPLNILLDATCTNVPLAREDEMRFDWNIPADEWKRLMLTHLWANDAELDPLLPARLPLPTYKRLRVCHPIHTVRVSAGALPADLTQQLLDAGVSITRIAIDGQEYDDVLTMRVEPETSSCASSSAPAAMALSLPVAGIAVIPFFVACASLQRQLKGISMYGVRLARSGCHRGLHDAEDAIRVWRKDSCSADTTTKTKHNIRLI